MKDFQGCLNSLLSSQYLWGILTAVFVFLINEIIKFSMSGFKFRRIVTQDIELTVTGLYQAHERLLKDVHNASDPRKLRFLYSADFPVLNGAMAQLQYLHKDVSGKISVLYSLLGRITPACKDYNNILLNVAMKNPEDSITFDSFRKAILEALLFDVRKAIITGCESLLLMKEKHSGIKINVKKYSDILQEIREVLSNPQSSSSVKKSEIATSVARPPSSQ